MQDLVSNILICCTFELAGGEHEKLQREEWLARPQWKWGVLSEAEVLDHNQAHDLRRICATFPLPSTTTKTND